MTDIGAWAADLAISDMKACLLAGTTFDGVWSGEHATALANELGVSIVGEDEITEAQTAYERAAIAQAGEYALARGIKALGARALRSGEYAHRDDGMRRWYVVSASDVESYVRSERDDEEHDAYSHWCARTTTREATQAELVELGESDWRAFFRDARAGRTQGRGVQS